MKASWPAIAMALAATAMFAPATHAATTKAIVGATVVNIDGGAPIENAVVIIDGERITAIGPAARTPVPAGAEVIQMPGTWLIPGLMNMHVHFGLKLPGKDRAALADETTAELALRMMVNARKSLAVGVTTPLQALRSATIESATMLRAQKDIGSLEAGKYADILAVNADPLKNISALRNIVMIMKGGAVYRNDSADSIASGP